MIRYLGVPSLIAILVLFTMVLGGKIEVVFPIPFLVLNLMMLLVCFLNVRLISEEEGKTYLLWFLLSLVAGLVTITTLRIAGRNSYLSWNIGLWDFIVPIILVGAQILFFWLRKHNKI